MQSHLVHQLVHDEGSAGHVARVLHQRDEKVEYQDLWQEDDDAAHTAYDTVDEHRLQRTFGHRPANKVPQPVDTFFYPVHGVLSQYEGGLKHQEEQQEEDGESQILVREHTVYQVGRLVGVFLRASLELRLLQRTVDEAVLAIHDGRFRVGVRFLHHTGRGLVAGVGQLVEVVQALLAGHVLPQVVEHLAVVLQQFQGQESGRVVLGDVLVGLQVFLYVTDALLNLVTVVDVQVSRLAAGALIHLDDGFEEFFHTHAALERGGNHRDSEECRQRLYVHRVASSLKLVEHIEGAYHLYVHVHQLGGQIEVALQVRGIYHADHHVGHLLRQVFPHVQLLRRVAAQRVGAWQVGQVELIAEERGVCLCGIDGDA